MNQSLNNLTLKVEQFSSILIEKGFAQIQQVTSSAHILCIQCRVPGRTAYLYLGRGVVNQGFDFGTNKVPAFLRIQDKFLQYARKNWRGMQLNTIGCSTKDRVLSLEGRMGPYKQTAYFFWRGRDLFFANLRFNDHSGELFTSWEGKRKIDPVLIEKLGPADIFGELGFGEVEFGQQKSKDFSFSSYLDQFSSDEQSEVRKSKDLKTLTKMKEELKRFKSLEVLERFKTQDLESINSVGEGRFKVRLNGLVGHYKRREYLFDRLKLWKKSEARLLERIAVLENRLAAKTDKPIVEKRFKTVQPIWKVEKKKNDIITQSSHIEFYYGDWRCFLGRTAQENDYIRKEKAKKEDWWLHLEDLKSGHMIIKTQGKTLNPDDLSTLGSALIELCGLDYSDIPLIFTQVKNLKGIKGVPGSVNFKKEKHLKVIFNPSWRQKLTSIE